MIKDCFWKGKRLSCSAIFSMHPTDRGVCCSFNKEKAQKLLRPSRYRDQIERLTEHDKTMSSEDSSVPEWPVCPGLTYCTNFPEHLLQAWSDASIRTIKWINPSTRCPHSSCQCIFSNWQHSGIYTILRKKTNQWNYVSPFIQGIRSNSGSKTWLPYEVQRKCSHQARTYGKRRLTCSVRNLWILIKNIE